MTHDEIAQMDAAQLRLAIAEVKGWEKLHEIAFSGCLCGKRDGHVNIVPDWPRDIAASWELVEEMQDQGACVEMGNGWGDPDWRVRIMIEGSYRYVWADTAPLAICRAWLMWKQT